MSKYKYTKVAVAVAAAESNFIFMDAWKQQD